MRLLFVAGVLCILALSGCSAKPTNTIQECEEEPLAELRDLCYQERAFSSNDVSYCTQIIDADIRNECINFFP